MKQRTIGPLSVSEIGVGCMGFSHGYGKVPAAEESINAMRKAYETGCTFFDTAEVYGDVLYWPGHNEELVGRALKPFRQDVALATKLHLGPAELADGTTVEAAVRRHLEASMKRLDTDYVDLYYLHRINEQVPFEDVAAAMGKLIAEGKIRAWGMSQVDVDTLAAAHAVTLVAALQNIYSMVERDSEKSVIPFCLTHNIALVAFSPIASGLLSGKITTQTEFEAVDDVRKFVPQLTKENIAGNQPLLDVVSDFAQRKHATMAQISLAWMLKQYPNVVPIPGSKRLDACTVYGNRGCVETEQTSFGNNWKKAQQ